MPILSLWAAGYPNPYDNDAQEISAFSGGGRGGLRTHDPDSTSRAQDAHLRSWWAHSVDFRAESDKTRPSRGVSNVSEMLHQIEQYNNLSEVRIYGHGSATDFNFGGSGITIADVSRLRDVSSHFHADGVIIFYACNMGFSGSLLQEMSNHLRVHVRGFTQGIRWIVRWNVSTMRITERGRDLTQVLHPVNCTPMAPH